MPRFADGLDLVRAFGDRLEQWAQTERTQLPLWTPVCLGMGIASWFVLPDAWAWTASLCLLAAIAVAAATLANGGRVARLVMSMALLMMVGLSLVWLCAESLAAPILSRPVLAEMVARVETVDHLAARQLRRVMLHPAQARDGRGRPITLPPRIRVSLADNDAPAGLGPGAVIRLRARLMPPAGPVAPGGYDFARAAWFQGIGATGRGFAPVTILRASRQEDGLRQRLSRRITERVAGSAGGIAAALATGDVGAIGQADAEAMRRAGLAHLLSVSGLHITAVVGIVMTITIRLLALWPWLAVRVRLPLIGALAGALAAIGYTWLTGAEVPTIRSCVAAMLVLAALALGREAMTLRLVAAGALIVLLFRPEALMGASFQLSFAAITAIIALHEHPVMRRWFGAHPDWRWSIVRQGGALLVTGLVVEAALMPIAIFHFHKAGLYGAFANIVAIPWTTFIAMPIEMLALLFEPLGVGGAVVAFARMGVGSLVGVGALCRGAARCRNCVAGRLRLGFCHGSRWRTLAGVVADAGAVDGRTPHINGISRDADGAIARSDRDGGRAPCGDPHGPWHGTAACAGGGLYAYDPGRDKRIAGRTGRLVRSWAMRPGCLRNAVEPGGAALADRRDAEWLQSALGQLDRAMSPRRYYDCRPAFAGGLSTSLAEAGCADFAENGWGDPMA